MPPFSGPGRFRPYYDKLKLAALPASAFAAGAKRKSHNTTKTESAIRKNFPENWIWETIEK